MVNFCYVGYIMKKVYLDMSSATHGVVLPVPVDEHGEGAVDGRVLGDGDLALEGPSHLHI